MAITDNFNRANAGSLGTGWLQQNGESDLGISSNATIVTDIFNFPSASRRTDSWGADQSSQAKLLTAGASFRNVSVRVRCSDSARTYYAGGIENFDLGSQLYRIWKVVAGTVTNLNLHGSAQGQVNDVVKLSITGSNLSLVVNSVEILTASDSAIASGNPGIGAFASSAIAAWDDWEGTGEGSTVKPAYLYSMMRR